MKSYVEHANITVSDTDHTIKLLLTALPDWSIRGEGVNQDWFGKSINWYHVGNENSYIAIQSGGEEKSGHWSEHWTGVKHIGIAVPDLEALITRLENAGFPIDHRGADHPHRKNVYFLDQHNIQFEFVEYLSSEPTKRNDYSL
ncbi:lactoylglutathione lyase [Photobacterium sanctipauli]|uniref:Lactoylglutathione lyase n=1 Tax=Photobacterium sanctipauli TaxID=1342794 RepID=A0A2T3P181_9GAMM|nr:VOC family protein [Photobacterium sanctipauli]PSW22291.1 lactoylglutathione lyase [Photobacterium sanctipauli]